MDTTGSKMNVNFAFGFQVLWIELDLVILLLSLGLDQERISEIFVMQVKGRFVVAVSVRLDDLSIGDLGVLDKDVGIHNPLAVRPADEPFDGEPMIGFVRCRAHRGKGDAQAQQDKRERESWPSWLCLSPTGARARRSRHG